MIPCVSSRTLPPSILLSQGRAEIVVGRGSFIEAFPLFGLDLDNYDSLFAEKLDLLLKIRDNVQVHWSGTYRAPLTGQGGLSPSDAESACPSGSASAAPRNPSSAPARWDFR